MEFITTYVGEEKLHLILKLIGLLCLPFFTIIYLLFSLITIPLTFVIWHFYKKQITTYFKGQYQQANAYVQQLGLCKNVTEIPTKLIEIFTYSKNWILEQVSSLFNSITSLVPDTVLQQISSTKTKLGELLTQGKEQLLAIGVVQTAVIKLDQVLDFILDFKNISISLVKAGPKVPDFIHDLKNISISMVEAGYKYLFELAIIKYVVVQYQNFVVPALNYVKANIGIDYISNFAFQKIVQIPNTKQHIIGYAILNESGKTIQNLKDTQEIDRFIIQKHQFAVTQFWKVKSLKDLTILELECGDGVGLQYIAETYQPKGCLGIDSSEFQIQENIKQFSLQENLKFEAKQPLEVGALCSPNTFDIIMALELKKKPAFRNVDLKSYIRVASTLLKDDGYFIIGDYDTQEQMQQFQQDIQQNGMIITEKCDFTVGVSQAMRLQAKYIKQQVNQNGNCLAKLLARHCIKPNENLFQQFKDREQIYMVYVLKKGSI